MKSVLLLAIRVYQWLLSPLLLPACRFTPTCSQYAADAVELHGPMKGALLATWRLMRCHPFSSGGFDPASGINSAAAHSAATNRNRRSEII